MKPAMKLWLVRHPVTLAPPGACYGASDVAVAAHERERVAQQLLHSLAQPLQESQQLQQPLISSPLQRCEQLAQVLSRAVAGLGYQTDARIQEMDFGHWELQPWAAISRQETSDWSAQFAHYRCGQQGESTAMLMQRVAQRLLESLRSEAPSQIWVTHAGVIRALLWLHERQVGKVFWAALRTGALWRQIQASEWPTQPLPWGAAFCLKWARPPD
jgi:alpha-ribazole phosphatase